MADITEARKTLKDLQDVCRRKAITIPAAAPAWRQYESALRLCESEYSDEVNRCMKAESALAQARDENRYLRGRLTETESALAQAREENERLRQTSYLIDCMSLQARIEAALTELLATHGHLASEAIAESIKKAEKALKGEKP